VIRRAQHHCSAALDAAAVGEIGQGAAGGEGEVAIGQQLAAVGDVVGRSDVERTLAIDRAGVVQAVAAGERGVDGDAAIALDDAGAGVAELAAGEAQAAAGAGGVDDAAVVQRLAAGCDGESTGRLQGAFVVESATEVSVPLPPSTVDTMKAASLPLLVKLVAVTVAPVVACTVPRLVSEPPWDVSVEPARMTLLALLLFRLNR
jgi:hypothetical protein